MTTIVTRAAKGSPLTNNEVDANAVNLKATADAALPKAGGAMSGAITTNSTFDGRDVATDGTKLDGIEASADVTDTANVTAAGALMDSELTSIASVKALNQGVATGDSPTFAAVTSTGEITANGGIALGDGDELTLGDSDEFKIKHHASGYTHLQNTVGTLYIDSDSVTFRDDDGSPSNMVISQTGIDVGGNLTLATGGSIVAGGANDLILNAGESGTPDIYLQSGGSTKVKIEGSNGNVGIGKAVPAYILDIEGASPRMWMKDTTSSGSHFEIGVDTSAVGLGNRANLPLNLFTNNTTRMTIDTSGNVLVGQTSNSETGSGIGLVPDGTSHMYSGSTDALMLGRGGSDGEILSFNKSGTTVGSIGTNGGRPYFVNSVDGGIHLATDGYGRALVLPANESGAPEDNLHYLGSSSYRWRDLYLSGGVYLGGTGAANKLSDFETGVFTPTLTFGGASVGLTYYSQLGRYTKVGRQVTVQIAFYINSKGSSTGAAVLSGLPFHVTTQGGGFSSYSGIAQAAGFSSLTGATFASADENTATVVLRQSSTTGFANLTEASFNASCYMMITITYFT